MEGWPRIPNQQGGASSPRPKATIPAPGTVVMANVDEDLGDGVYSLRWGNNRVAVTSRSPLKTGQSLILKSELNAEGKPTLVVQGTALPTPGSITGKIIYGPGKTPSQLQNNQIAEEKNAAGETSARDSRPAQTQGDQVAAGTSRPTLSPNPTPTQPIRDLVGLVLEPMPEFDDNLKMLEEAAQREKDRVDRQNAEAGQGRQQANRPQGETGDNAQKSAVQTVTPEKNPATPETPSDGNAKATTPPQGAPAADQASPPPERAVPAPLPGVSGTGSQPTVQEQPQPPATAETPPDSSKAAPPQGAPAADQTSSSPERAVPAPLPGVPGTGSRPAVQEQPQAPATAETLPDGNKTAPPQGAPAADQTSPPPERAIPAPLPGVSGAGSQPAVPEQPQASAPPETLPDGSKAAPLPAPSQAVPQVPAGEQAQTPQQPPASNGQPSAPIQANTAGPAIPDVPVAAPQQPSAPAENPSASAPATPPTPAAPAVPVAPIPTPGDGQTVPEAATPPASVPADTSGGIHDLNRAAPPAMTGTAPPPEQTVSEVRDIQPGNAGPAVPEAPPVADASQTGSATPPETARPAPQPQSPPPPPSSSPSSPVADTAPEAVRPVPIPAGTPGQGETAAPAETKPNIPESGKPETPAAPAPDIPAVQPVRRDAPSTRPTGIYGPPRRDTDALRQRQATLPSPADNGTDAASDAARDRMKPEVFFKEALTQMVKAAELPLGGSEAAPSLAVGGKPPGEVIDKAAELFLRAAGVEPDTETMEAARALVRQSAHVDKESVEALLNAAAEVPEAEREAVLNAAARLAAKDIPVSPPLTAGMADVLDRRAGAHELVRQTMESLSFEADVAEAQPLIDGARGLLDMLHIDLGAEDASQALERYLSTFGRETLGRAAAMVETAAQAVLEANPELQRLDQAIAAVLTELTGEMATAQQEQLQQEGATLNPNPGLSLEQLPPIEAQPLPAPLPPMAPINAYLNAPRAFNVAEALKNLPPMPKIVSINSPVPQEATPLPAQTGQTQTPPAAAVPPPTMQQLPPQLQPPPPAPAPASPPQMQPQVRTGDESAALARLDSLFETPGLNRPEMELLRPSGFLERFLGSSMADAPDAEKVKRDARTLMRQLTSEIPEQVNKALKELKEKPPETLKETAARLIERETETLRANAVLNRLADASSGLRDLGRQLLAVKAENLAGQDRDPGVMLAEIPFRLNDDSGDGRMQMFYRRSKKKDESWTSRVILDLNTTRMGPVLGDMRFFGQDMILNMFVERQDTADYLDASGGDLTAALADKGFRVKARFMVLPPRKTPEIRAERPEITGEETPSRGADGGKLDIKG